MSAMTATAPATRSEWAEDRLRQAILRGELRPGQRLHASDLAADEAARIYQLRLLLEPLALRQSLEASDDQHRDEIRAAFGAFRGAQSTLEGVEAHAEFHRVLLSRCPSTWLLRFTTQLADASRLYQVASVGSGPGRRHLRGEHEAIR